MQALRPAAPVLVLVLVLVIFPIPECLPERCSIGRRRPARGHGREDGDVNVNVNGDEHVNGNEYDRFLNARPVSASASGSMATR